MMEIYKNTFEVHLMTTNALDDYVYNHSTEKQYVCKDGCIYIVTTNPEKIYVMFGDSNIISIKKVGIGYTI